jgi:hypothetical protein
LDAFFVWRPCIRERKTKIQDEIAVKRLLGIVPRGKRWRTIRRVKFVEMGHYADRQANMGFIPVDRRPRWKRPRARGTTVFAFHHHGWCVR